MRARARSPPFGGCKTAVSASTRLHRLVGRGEPRGERGGLGGGHRCSHRTRPVRPCGAGIQPVDRGQDACARVLDADAAWALEHCFREAPWSATATRALGRGPRELFHTFESFASLPRGRRAVQPVCASCGRRVAGPHRPRPASPGGLRQDPTLGQVWDLRVNRGSCLARRRSAPGGWREPQRSRRPHARTLTH